MPASDISRLSIAGQPKSDMASQMARESANREITLRVSQGHIDRLDVAALRREWKDIYKQEYYRYYAILMLNDQQERIIYVATENPSARKFYNKHAVAGFNKTNCFVHVHKSCITVGKFNYPIDGDLSLDTKEAFLLVWPGPLDRQDDNLKRKTTDYIDTLWQHDSQRRIRYCSNDEQRKVILRLLAELLHRNGSIDASSITRLLLNPEQTEIQKDDGSRKPLETLLKYLLLGKRSDAIKYAKARKLWDHAQCLAFLDKYQPPGTGNYFKDGSRLRDDSIVQLNDEFITSLEHAILNTVYRSLLNRILQSDPESLNIVKHPNVDNDAYQFALLSANDCEMEYDQTNEIFRLVNAIKKATIYPSVSDSHLISLGLTTLETPDPMEDMSYRSHLSFGQNDTYCSRTLVISNIDLLILNEIWEYSLNLARKTNDPVNYNYIIDLVPYKLIFASRLLDLGLYDMFEHYLISIERALAKAPYIQDGVGDQFYDWNAIEFSVKYLRDIWKVFRPHLLQSPEVSNPATGGPSGSGAMAESLVGQMNNLAVEQNNMAFELPPPRFDLYSPPEQQHNALFQDFSAPHMPRDFSHSLPATIQEEAADFNPDPDPYEQPVPESFNEQTYKPNQEAPRHEAPSHEEAPSQTFPKYETTRHGIPRYEVPRHEAQRQGTAPSEVSEQDNYLRRNSYDNRPYEQNNGQDSSTKSTHQSPPAQGPVAGTSTGNSNDPAAQQASLFANLAGSVRSLLPKSNSKQMILPDDSNKNIVYDEGEGRWVDKTKSGDQDDPDVEEPPPMAPIKSPTNYSYAARKANARYPKPPGFA